MSNSIFFLFFFFKSKIKFVFFFRMVASYLVHQGYSSTAETFTKTTGQELKEDLSSIKHRQSKFSKSIFEYRIFLKFFLINFRNT